MALKLTSADRLALDRRDTDYIIGEAEDALLEENYHEAIELFRLSAAMGSEEAYLNLGLCYLYGRGTSENMDLAAAYFKMAADSDSVEALYNLGKIYCKGSENIPKDRGIGLYYYDEAVAQIHEQGFAAEEFPDLYFNYAKELMKDDDDFDTEEAFDYLLTANEGYSMLVEAGVNTFQEACDETEELLALPCFDEIKAIYDEMAEEMDEEKFEKECGCGRHHR